MFVTIRRYSPKNGAVNKASLDLLRRQIQNDFLPIIQKVPGFKAYYVLNVANQEVVTLSFCETREGTADSNQCASDYTLRNPLVYELGLPEVTEAEVLTFAESSGAPAEELADGQDPMAAAIALWLEESRGMLLSVPEP
jgi:hypothetical protein